MRGRFAKVVVGLLLALLAGCQTQTAGDPGPVSDTTSLSEATPGHDYLDLKPGERPPPDSDEAGLWMVMDKQEQELKTSGRRYRDPALEKYVSGVACRLAGPYCKDIRVYLVRIPLFNATMSPNGVMQVWTGLLLRTRNEAQLAAVLGHEIGHYIRRHSLQRFRDARDTSNFLVFFRMALAVTGIPVAGDVAQLIAVASLQSFSRDNEREADDLGVERMAEAGYDPGEAANLWRSIVAEQNADEEGHRQSLIFATHPNPEERIRNLDDRVKKLVAQYGNGRKFTDRYRKMIAPHRARFLRDETYLRRFARADKMLEILLKDGFHRGELLFFRGELKRLQGGKENLKKARAYYDEAIGSGQFPPVLFKYLGLVHQRLGDPSKARSAYREYLRRVPDAEDRLMIESMLNRIG